MGVFVSETGSDKKPEMLMTIGDVVEMVRRDFPDVSHSSLRFLERQGLVTSTRTSGGHRLYTQADVERIRRIKRWQRERLSLDTIGERLRQFDQMPATERMASDLFRHAREGDLARMHTSVLEAANAGMPLEQLFGELLEPTLIEVGRHWESGDLLVAQEKEISELARELIVELTIRHLPQESPGPPIVAACVAGEHHDLGLRMVCGLLRMRGYRVHFLGANVAADILGDAIELHRPTSVLLSARMESNLESTVETIASLVALQDLDRRPEIIVGGRIAVEYADVVRAHGAIPVTQPDLRSSVEAIAGLLSTAK